MPRSVKWGKVYHSQARTIIASVLQYFDRERDNKGPLKDVKKFVERVSEACQVSIRTVGRIRAELKSVGADTSHSSDIQLDLPEATEQEATSTLAALAALACCCLAQERYGPYRGPPVVPVILPGGFLADTQEVAAAKNYHLNVLNQVATGASPKGNSAHGYHNAKAYQPPQSAYQPAPGRYQSQGGGQRPSAYRAQQQAQRYTHPAYQPLSLQYTQPQQQALYRPKQQAYRPAAPVQEGDDYDDGQYRHDVPVIYTTARPDPLVTPKILDNGYIADTQEVDAAKAEHFAAVARAQEAVVRAQQAAAAKAAAAPPQPARGYDAPARGYDAPSTGYDAPARGYDAPARGYDGPARGYDAPARGYDAPSRGSDTPARGYDDY